MSVEVLMPQLGETVAEGKILAWRKAVGDEVRAGDDIFEVETDKVTMEVQAIASGRLSEIRVEAGAVAGVGTVVAVIGGQDGVGVPRTNGTNAAPPQRPPFEEVATAAGSYGRARGPQGLRVTPLARRLIAQHGLDLDAIARRVSGQGGSRIARDDVLVALGASKAASAVSSPPRRAEMPAAERPAATSGATVIELNGIRRRTGERLTENWRTIPHVFQAIEVDFTGVEAVRAARKDQFKAQYGQSLTYLPFIVRAACLTLRAFPQVNARLDGTSLILAGEVNLGIAVDLSHDGLVVPVLRNADDLNVSGLARAIGRLVDKARAGKLAADDLSGGTYSISNNGAFGTSFTAPIINAPQVAILSVDAIRRRPAVVETSEGVFVAPRPIGMVGQSFDHRAFDGAYSAAFLSQLKATIEGRDWSAEFE